MHSRNISPILGALKNTRQPSRNVAVYKYLKGHTEITKRSFSMCLRLLTQSNSSLLKTNPVRITNTRHTIIPTINTQRRSFSIQTSTTPNPDALKFIPNQRILPESYGTKTIEFLSDRDAHSSPLAQKLFAIDGVKSIMLGPDWLTVEKVKSDQGSVDGTSPPWSVLKSEVFAVLSEYLAAGLPVIVGNSHEVSQQDVDEDEDEVVSMIKELIETRIRPAIQEDGGDIEYKGFTPEGIVQLKLQGACRSCDSSSVTLKHGIEGMLMHYIEEVTGVEQVLDPEEQIGLDEFAKLEKKLQQKEHN